MRPLLRSPAPLTLFSLALAVAMVATTFPLGAAGPGDDAPTSRIGTVSIGGITWTEDIRVTRNGATDERAQVTVDASHNAHVLWQSQRAPAGYYYVQLNRLGDFLSQETFISDKVLAGWGDQYPMGPTIDIDSNANLHLTYDNGWSTIYYTKFDEQGNVLVNEKQVGPTDSWGSHTPSIAVGIDDTVHISHEEYRFQCEDIAYDKLDNNGGDIWIDRVVSSDVASHCEFDLIKADRFNGNIMFTFGSSTGTWLARFNKFGVKDMPSINIRTQTDLRIADVAATPNGNMHVVWNDGGQVLYTMVNATGAKVVTDRPISSSASQSPGFPRIAAASDNRAVVVWDDARFGNREIIYVVIQPGHEGDTDPPENIRLTNAQGDKTQPWIAIDPDDNFHVVWTDTRDGGNKEIYYKFAYNFALELTANPIDIANMFFIHPNETKVLPMLLRNKGGLVDGYNIDLSFVPTDMVTANNWRISIDRTYVEQLQSQETLPLNLTIYAPPNAKEGDNITTTINASSTSAPTEFDIIQFPTFVQVSRELRLSGDAQKSGKNGETVSFGLFITNRGDVREDDIQLQHVIGAGENWPVQLSKSSVSLDPGQSTNFTVFITVPEDAPGSVPGLFQIAAFSSIDTTVRANMQLTVIPATAIDIVMSASPEQRSVKPGETAAYTIHITNQGNLPSAVKIDLTAQNPANLIDWTATIDRNVVYLRGSESTSIELQVYVAPGAVADTRLELVVSGFSANYAAEGRVTVTTLVERIKDLQFGVSAPPPVKVGRSVSYDLTVTNLGNGDESLELFRDFAPEAWTLDFLDGPASISNVFVAHGQAKTIQARVGVSSDAVAGTHYPTVRLQDRFGGSHQVILTTVVEQFFAVSITATEFKLDGSPGTRIEYSLEVTNNGNGWDNFTLNTLDLPPGFEPEFYRITRDAQGLELREKIEGTLELRYGQVADLALSLSIPLTTTQSQVEFSAFAESSGQEEDGVILVIAVKKADLRPGVITFTPEEPDAGQITAITVEILNSGEIDAQPVIVVFRDNGQEIARETLVRVAASQRGFVTFAWLPTVGEHNLEFEADPLEGPSDIIGLVVEKDELNNKVTARKDVGTSGPTLPGFEAPLAVSIIALAALAGAGRRRREA